MIRINLLPVRERKRRREGRQLLMLFAVLLAGQALGLYYMHAGVSKDLAALGTRLRTVESEIGTRESLQQRIVELERIKGELHGQISLFNNLKLEREGPSKLLLFLAYVLTPRIESAYTRDELRVHERIGWDTNWDPSRVWLSAFIQKGEELSLTGSAISHEDVSEFSKRLEAGVFFPGVEPISQVQVYDRELQISTVDFKLRSGLRFGRRAGLK